MSDELLREALTGRVEELLERHLKASKEWFPHLYVPYSRGRDYEANEVFDADLSPLNAVARAAMTLNLLTEDNLPYYTSVLLSQFGPDSAWGEWSRRWTAEEARHAVVIRDYLMVTKSVDPIALERARMQTMQTGWDPQWTTLADAIAYPSLQELATRISHRNTGEHIEDEVGKEVLKRVVTDENHHFLFYRDLCESAIAVDPSAMVIALNRIVKDFAMPGVGVDGFAGYAKAIATAGIYDFSIHYEQILVPVVLRQYKIEELQGLSPEAEVAREEMVNHIARIGRVADRQSSRAHALAAQ
jgi:acyl-[acyl-carrier-protein] desaturase